ncbi:MAG TPA: dihydroneopterin aldolase, partial [Caulobacteraceae bacterium]
MPEPVTSEPGLNAAPASKIVITKVFVRGLEVDAAIGVYRHEKGRLQRLVIDVELDVAVTDWSALSETVNYEVIAEKARRVAAEGHRGLVET